MIILGIDPGTTRIGYGIIKDKPISLLDYGTIEIDNESVPERLLELEQKLSKLIKKYKPGVIGVEQLFFSKNKKTALDVAQARGVVILTAGRRRTPVREFSPGFIKQGVTGYGAADKKAVSKMVIRILNIEGGENQYDDAFDALAVAITTAHSLIDRG